MTLKLLNVYNDALLSGCVATAHIVTANAYELLQLPSLELRRFRIDLIWCYKIVFGLVDLCTYELLN